MVERLHGVCLQEPRQAVQLIQWSSQCFRWTCNACLKFKSDPEETRTRTCLHVQLAFVGLGRLHAREEAACSLPKRDVCSCRPKSGKCHFSASLNNQADTQHQHGHHPPTICRLHARRANALGVPAGKSHIISSQCNCPKPHSLAAKNTYQVSDPR